MMTEPTGNHGERATTEDDPSTSKVAERTLDVLLCLMNSGGELGVSEIARRVGIHKSRAHRFLVALKRRGFVIDNPATRRYTLSVNSLALGKLLTRQLQFEDQVQPLLREVRDRCGESAGVTLRIGCRRVHVAQVESRHELRHSYPLFRPVPLHIGAGGRVLLAFMDENERDICLADSVAEGPERSPEELSRFRAELQRVRRQGFALSLSERILGSRSVAVPVWNWQGLEMALTTSGPEGRFSEEAALRAVPMLQDVAWKLTTALGGESHARQQLTQPLSPAKPSDR